MLLEKLANILKTIKSGFDLMHYILNRLVGFQRKNETIKVLEKIQIIVQLRDENGLGEDKQKTEKILVIFITKNLYI